MNQHSATTDQATLATIHQFLMAHSPQLSNPGVKWGKLGVAVFLMEWSAAFGDTAAANQAMELIEQGIEQLNSGDFEGNPVETLADVGRALQLLASRQHLDDSIQPLLESLDPLLMEQSQSLARAENFDLVSGALCPAWYLLERLPSQPSCQPVLEALIDQLELAAKNHPAGGIYWPSKIFQDDRVYLGLSHGNAGIIQWLLACHQKNIRPQQTLTLTALAMDFIDTQALKDNPCFYPIVAGHPPTRSPLGWAYGDLGTLYALLQGALRLQQPVRITACLEKLLALEDRWAREDLWHDAGLAYGTTGSSILFSLLAAQFQEPRLAHLAEACLEASFRYQQPEHPACGFRAAYQVFPPGADWGLMSGLAGIGLCFLAHQQGNFEVLQKILYL